MWITNIGLAIASSVFSFCFETWMVSENEKQGHKQDLLNETFWLMTFFESASLIGSQGLANLRVKDLQKGFLSSSAPVVLLAMISIICIRKEWKGDQHKFAIENYRKSFAGHILKAINKVFDLAVSLTTLEDLASTVGKDKLVVSTFCSLMHTAGDLVNETKLDDEIKSWLAFAAQKVVEVYALAGSKDERTTQASRKSSPRVTYEEVQKPATALKGSDHRRTTNVSTRLDAQQKNLNLPILPTTIIGSFPQTVELRRVRCEYKANKISKEQYIKAIKEEISKVVKLQEELDIDVLVHGEPERNDMVKYFGE